MGGGMAGLWSPRRAFGCPWAGHGQGELQEVGALVWRKRDLAVYRRSAYKPGRAKRKMKNGTALRGLFPARETERR